MEGTRLQPKAIFNLVHQGMSEEQFFFALEHAVSNSVPRRKHAPLLPPRFISAVHTVLLPLQIAFSGLLRNHQLRVLFTHLALQVQTFFYVLEL